MLCNEILGEITFIHLLNYKHLGLYMQMVNTYTIGIIQVSC